MDLLKKLILIFSLLFFIIDCEYDTNPISENINEEDNGFGNFDLNFKISYINENTIYLMNGDGSGKEKLLSKYISPTYYDYSEVIKKFLFFSKNGLFTCDLLSREIDTLATNIFSDMFYEKEILRKPRFSLDGKKIVFVTELNDSININIINTDGTDVKRLSWDGAINVYPNFSHDSHKIVYISESSQIHIFDLLNMKDEIITNESYRFEYPSFAPDDNAILTVAGDRSLFLVSLEGNLEKIFSTDTGVILDPKFSKDGTKILYSVVNYIPEIKYEASAYLYDLNSQKVINLSESDQKIIHADFAFNDEYILAYISERSDFEIGLIQLQTKDILLLTNNEIDDTEPKIINCN